MRFLAKLLADHVYRRRLGYFYEGRINMNVSFIILYVDEYDQCSITVVRLCQPSDMEAIYSPHPDDSPQVNDVVTSRTVGDEWKIGSIRLGSIESYDEGVRTYSLLSLGTFRNIEVGEVFNVN